jgi:hypothetical protein
MYIPDVKSIVAAGLVLTGGAEFMKKRAYLSCIGLGLYLPFPLWFRSAWFS